MRVSAKLQNHRKRIETEERAKVVADAWGTELIQFLAALLFLHQDDLKKRVNIITATCWKGCFEKMDDQPVAITPNHHLPEVVVLL